MSELSKQEYTAAPTGAERTRSGESYSPRIDIVETHNELTLYADMPGVAPGDVDLRFEDGELSLEGRVTVRNEGVNYVYREYGIGDFHRSFSIGSEIDASQISAEISNGVLKVHLPKAEALKPKRIKVRAGGD